MSLLDVTSGLGARPPVFVAVFKPHRTIARDVTPAGKLRREIDHVVSIAYDSTGQRWGFVERMTHGTSRRPGSIVSRGWVRLPMKILDETWPEGTA